MLYLLIQLLTGALGCFPRLAKPPFFISPAPVSAIFSPPTPLPPLPELFSHHMVCFFFFPLFFFFFFRSPLEYLFPLWPLAPTLYYLPSPFTFFFAYHSYTPFFCYFLILFSGPPHAAPATPEASFCFLMVSFPSSRVFSGCDRPRSVRSSRIYRRFDGFSSIREICC